MSKLYDVGRCAEYPDDSARFPGAAVLDAYASPDGRRVCVIYRATISRSGAGKLEYGDRWVTISREWVDVAMKKGDAFRTEDGVIDCDRCVLPASNKPQCDITKMDRLESRLVRRPREHPRGKVIGTYYDSFTPAFWLEELSPDVLKHYTYSVSYVCVVTRAGGMDSDVIEFRLPRVYHRSAGGYCAQLLQPLAAVLDILTFPIQLPAMKEH